MKPKLTRRELATIKRRLAPKGSIYRVVLKRRRNSKNKKAKKNRLFQQKGKIMECRYVRKALKDICVGDCIIYGYSYIRRRKNGLWKIIEIKEELGKNL